jgi:hypothetical protein
MPLGYERYQDGPTLVSLEMREESLVDNIADIMHEAKDRRMAKSRFFTRLFSIWRDHSETAYYLDENLSADRQVAAWLERRPNSPFKLYTQIVDANDHIGQSEPDLRATILPGSYGPDSLDYYVRSKDSGPSGMESKVWLPTEERLRLLHNLAETVGFIKAAMDMVNPEQA